MSERSGSGDDWRHESACRDADPELFITNNVPSIQAAKAICRQCVVREDCLNWAIENGQTSGTWGGYSEKDRRKMNLHRSATIE